MTRIRREELEKKNRNMSYVGWADSNQAIWGQYERMVDFLFQEYDKTQRRYDEISIPLLNTISHAIELALKENIIFFNTYSGRQSTSKFENFTTLMKSHNLDRLAAEFKVAFDYVHKKLKITKDQKTEFNTYYAKLEKLLKILERNAETFRYSHKLDKDGNLVKPSIPQNKKIDFLQIKELYQSVKTLFIGAPNGIGHYTDFVDYQKGNPNFKRGKGYLYCQRLPYDLWLFEKLHEEAVKEKKWVKIREHVYFDPQTKENYEITHWNGDIYIIAIHINK
jgi:hypothetical protein